MQINVGDSVGIILRVIQNDKEVWGLREGKVTSITTNTRGRRVKAKNFNPFNADDIDDVEFNTTWLEESPQLILVREPFILTDSLRERVNRWIHDTNEREANYEGTEPQKTNPG